MEIRMHFALLVGICLGVSQAAEQPIHQELADLSHVSAGVAFKGMADLSMGFFPDL